MGALKMFPLLLLLLAPGCLAALSDWSPFIGDPFFDPPTPSFTSFPSFADPFPSFGSAYKSPFSSSFNDPICRKIDDIPGLKFPPYSEAPKDHMKDGDLLKESVKQYTYKCRDNDGELFYMLRSSAVFATGNIHNKQNTANYYDKNKAPVSYSNLKVDHKKLWDFIEKEEEQKERTPAWPTTTSYYNPFLNPYAKYWQDAWKEMETSRPKCEARDPISLDKYPKIDVTDLADEDVKDTKRETYLCQNPKTGEYTILLKTSVRITTKSGGVINRYQSIIVPADKDGNPTETDRQVQTESGQSVSHSTLSAVSRGFNRR